MDLPLTIASIVVSLSAAIGTCIAAWAACRAISMQATPSVIAYLASNSKDPMVADFVVKNTGLSPAYDVHITPSKKLPVDEGFAETAYSGFLKYGISMLAPGEERRACLGRLCDMDKTMGDDVETIVIAFRKSNGSRSLLMTCPIETRSFRSIVTITTQEEKDMREALRSIKEIPDKIDDIQYVLKERLPRTVATDTSGNSE
jgi:hypothetical protein